MKVERSDFPPRFRPVVITMESQEEVDMLFHMANCDPDITLSAYVANGSCDVSAMTNIKGSLYHKLYNFFYGRK